MKLKKIEFQNFRNFKHRNSMVFSTDGKITIIYGMNGDGKTTLHQLFQWIFYNKVHFNKTASEKMYNLEYESEITYGDTFSVWGCIDFEHCGIDYSIRRELIYKKNYDGSKLFQEIVTLNKKDMDNNWNRISNPNEVIEEVLPSGLSEYFFFDGESMIADLAVKGKESANKLREALYTIFNLKCLENALIHIGSTELKTTVLGQLYLSKKINNNSDISTLKTNIVNSQNEIDEIKNHIMKLENEHKEKQDFVYQASERIGKNLSKKEYEGKRNKLKRDRDQYLRSSSDGLINFGKEIIETYPRMLISKTISDAKKRISLKVEETKLTPGITTELIKSLISSENCLCGTKLCEDNINHLRELLDILPPRSYKYHYDEFTRTANLWGQKYDRERIETYIKSVLNYRENAASCDFEIHKLDDEEKKSGKTYEKLIEDRQKAESRIDELITNITSLKIKESKYNIYLKQNMKKFDEETHNDEVNTLVNNKIQIMEEVKNKFENLLKNRSEQYSKLLKTEIQTLLNQMLTSKRTVTVSPDFFVRVFDNFNDESKSEGQFAVVSFAYIGGILKLLKKIALNGKEYPLVLDGPFSKLDPLMRQNVIDTIPDYATQIILFSKDDLESIIPQHREGYIYRLVSNTEQNVAQVKEGYHKNMFGNIMKEDV